MRTQLVLPNGVRVDSGYDALNRLTSVNQHKGATVLASYAYTLDPAGNRTQVVEADGSSIQWAYDDDYRLTNERRYDNDRGATLKNRQAPDRMGVSRRIV